jgi:hypothetical protein
MNTVYAATAAQVAAQNVVDRINHAILFPLMTLMTSVAVVIFLWGAFEMVMHADDDGARTKGRQHMIWGIIGLLVMISAFAILSIAAGTFGIYLPESY